MEAFNLWYAAGSLIAAAVTGLVILVYFPVSELIGRNRFEAIFGFPPPKGKRGPGSRPIAWDRRQKVSSYLSATAYEMNIHRKGRRFCLKWAFKALASLVELEDEQYREYKTGMVKELWRLFRRFISYHTGYLRERRKFRRAYELAERFGFAVHDDYRFYAQFETERKIKELKQRTSRPNLIGSR
ncbi:MAG: hypothetical protein BMS9Abin34_110 [Patescibacteria group bacterium]|nr:MAG: hypothetical protein BMS9Abin34_110 [Patescibacteria group bacterium]